MTLHLPAPAKLNLFLHVLGKRPDGYHNLQTVFQFIDYCDELIFVPRKDQQITLTPELIGVAPHNNLIIKAARLLQKHTQYSHGADITLLKNLPMGAGMGGGSSDAATTLLALNKLWDTKLSLNELAKLGMQLGADVPVFVHGQAAWAEGIGEQLSPMVLPEPWYVLLISPSKINTHKIFQDPRLTRDTPALKMNDYCMGQGHNDFELIVRQDYPEIADAYNWLSQFGKTRMTGTGCTLFAGFDTEREASTIAAQIKAPYQGIVAKGLNHSSLHVALFD